MKKRQCDCTPEIIACAHGYGMIAVLIEDGESDGGWSACIVKNDWRSFNRASLSQGTESEMREHFANLQELVRKGTLRKLMDFATKEGIA